MHIHIYVKPAANVLQTCTLMSKEHLYNVYSCTFTSAQNTCCKVHAAPTATKFTYIYTYTHMQTHTYAQECTCANMTLLKHAGKWLLRIKVYAQTYIHIHIYMYIHACVNPYIHTCRHMHICMFTNTHTYTQIRTRIQHVHMHTRKHAWNDSAAATARGADTDARSSARLFHSTQSTTFSTSNARTSSLYPLPERPLMIPINPPTSLSNISQNSSQTAASAVLLFHSDKHNRVHHSEKVPRSCIMAPCVVVERFQGKQQCSRAPVCEHAGCQARE